MRFGTLGARRRTSSICWSILASLGVATGALAGEPPPIQIPPIPTPAPPATRVPPPIPAPLPPPTPVLPPVTLPATPLMAAPLRVYILDGVDPLGLGGLREMTGHISSSGYETRYGSWYQVLSFEYEIRQVHELQPTMQFAIIGYSFGVYRAKALANRLIRDGIPVVMVGYIGGDYLHNSPSSVPSGAHVVNVTGNGFLGTGRNLFWNGTDLTGADNLRLGVNHFDLPKQQETLDALITGLGAPTGTLILPTTPPMSGGVSHETGRPRLSQAGAKVTAPGQPAKSTARPPRRSTSPAAAASLPYHGARR